MSISVGIPTKNRLDTLDKTLLSIAFQTLLPKEVIIVDDSDNPVDIRNIPHYEYILRLLNDKGVDWRVVWGVKKGQHYSHQTIQEIATGEYIFRIDDDEVAEPDVLKKLLNSIEGRGDSGKLIKKQVGAVAPAVLMPNSQNLPPGLRNTLKGIDSHANMQWFKGSGVYTAEHLYSCFLYRKGVAKYPLELSTVCHREETIFSHSIKRAGYELIVNMDAQVHHFRAPEGGIRTFRDSGLWDHDEKIFRGYLNLWGIGKDEKVVILDNGLGDHYAFKHILPALQKRYKNLTIAACFPEAFEDEDVKLISIAEAKLIYGNIDNLNIYKWMGDRNWSGTLVEAFKQLYLGETNNIPLQQAPEKRQTEPQKLSSGILDSGYKLIGT